MPAGAGHQIIQKRLLRGVACGSPDGSMPRGAWTARARPTLLAALIRARAGNPCEDPIVFHVIIYFFFFFFFGRNYRIFDCLDIPKNSPNLEYKSHLAKNFIFYCRPEVPPLGGAVIKHSAFWLISPIYFVAHSKTLYPRVQ